MFHHWLWWQINGARHWPNPETLWYANWQWPERLKRFIYHPMTGVVINEGGD